MSPVQASELDMQPGDAHIVTLRYSDLTDPTCDLTSSIAEAYGPEGLGILLVSGVPRLPELRQELLPLAERFAELPAEVRGKCEDPVSSYNFGWSHGKEALAGGRPDVHKGSYYANPVHNEVTTDPELMRRYPSYCRRNVWPGQELPELEPAFRRLGQLVIAVGQQLAAHCDAYIARLSGAPAARRLRQIIADSPCPKGRLLHYFATAADGEHADWCGWHTDHGSLTGLTAAMYLRVSHQVPSPDPAAGLYIRTRRHGIVQARIPADQLAYQMGEASQACARAPLAACPVRISTVLQRAGLHTLSWKFYEIHSGGLLRATPHHVRSPAVLAAGVTRNTFAVFMQPRWDEPMEPPAGTDTETVGIGQWRAGMTFGEFSEATMAKYYGTS